MVESRNMVVIHMNKAQFGHARLIKGGCYRSGMLVAKTSINNCYSTTILLIAFGSILLVIAY